MKLRFTPYKIKRDHSNSSGFFIVRVPEVREVGIGFQLRLWSVVYGCSFTLLCM